MYTSFQFETLTKSSAEEAQTLKAQLEEQKEKARKEIQEVQRHGTDAQTELERRSVSVKRLEEEVSVLVIVHTLVSMSL